MAYNHEIIERQNEIFLSGGYNSLFSDDLVFQLSHRVKDYNKDGRLFRMAIDLFDALASSIITHNGQDAWVFDEVIEIIAPGLKFSSADAALEYLIYNCKIPEGHLVFGDNNQIYLSRYGLSLLSSTILSARSRLKADLGQELFIPPRRFVNKIEISSTMKFD